MSAEYGGTRSATSNAILKRINPVFDTVFTVNNNHGSAAHTGFNSKTLEKNNLKLDIIPISIIDHQFTILAYFNRFPVLDGISPLIIYKDSGCPTGSDRDGITGKYLDLV